MVSLGLTPAEIMLGFTAKAGEPLAGARQFPTHGASPKHNLVNLSNVVGTQIPQAVGSALASKMRGEDAVTIVYFGDGASSVGDCHEAMNFAAVHKLPVIFLCENNRYAISVPLSKQMAVDSVASRAEGYGMPGVVVDGTDITAVYEAVSEAAERARLGGGPTIVEAMVERYLPHTSDDDDSLYRSREDIAEARKRDPVRLLQEQLLGGGLLTEAEDEDIRDSAKSEINEATDFVEAAPYPDTDDFYEHVYAKPLRIS
jgi:2-oxoisovalerate dehydrogenase E1 component alpha subunit